MARLPLPTETELVAWLRRGDAAFPPLVLTWEEPPAGVDGVLRAAWQGKEVRFAAECKRAAGPRSLADAAEQARALARQADLRPLVVCPFLDEPALDQLEAAAVSGLDLCGNGVVLVPGRWLLRRTGAANPFRAEGAIKNVYRGASSVVARLFLARPQFASVQAARDEIARRGGGVTLATVSKVCRRLADDLLVERTRGGATALRLLQPDALLDRLAAGYAPPAARRRVTGKLRGLAPADLRPLLREWAADTGNRAALTGASSVGAYAVMARAGAEEYYLTDVAGAVRALGDRFQPADRFAAVTLSETPAEEVYFDRRDDLTASPVQTFLELAAGDKRDRETADQVRAVVLTAAGVRAPPAPDDRRRR